MLTPKSTNDKFNRDVTVITISDDEEENKKAAAKTHSNHSNHNDSFTKYTPSIVISDDEEVVPSDDEIYAASVNGYRTNPIWNQQKQNKPYVYNIYDDDFDLHDTDNEVVCLTQNSRRLSKAKSETSKNICKFDYSEYESDNEAVISKTRKRCRLFKNNKRVNTNDVVIIPLTMNKHQNLIHLRKRNMSDDDMWDDIVDIDGKVHGKHGGKNYKDEEAWEVDSNAYSVRSVPDDDDLASFINDASTDYETTDDENNDENNEINPKATKTATL